MHSDEPTSAEALGSVVAFEGRADTISTQLQLLPRSAQILILPGLKTYMPEEDEGWELDCQLYIAAVDAAIQSRNELAESFLQASTPKNKRIVFMAGGAPSAMAMCVERIMSQETNGDRSAAEQILRQHLSHGSWKKGDRTSCIRSSPFAFNPRHSQREEFLNDPILKAMRAADALDLLTADLQPSNELDLTMQNRSRSVSLPIYGYSDNGTEVDHFVVYGAQAGFSENESISPAPLKTPVFNTVFYDKPRKQSLSIDRTGLISPRYSGERFSQASFRTAASEFSIVSPTSDGCSIRTMDNVTFGQASMLDFRNSIRTTAWRDSRRESLLRPRSMDSMVPAHQGFDSFCETGGAEEDEQDQNEKISDGDLPSNGTIRPKSCLVVVDSGNTDSSRLQSIDRPRTVIVKSSQTTIKLQPVPLEKKRRSPPPDAEYIDRGTDAEGSTPEPEKAIPTFASLENMVLYIKEGAPNTVLHSAVNAFRNGEFPSRSRSAELQQALQVRKSLPGTPKTPSVAKASIALPTSDQMKLDRHDYDPFAYTQPTRQPVEASESAPVTVAIVRPPTPAQTPPPLESEVNVKFHDLVVAPNQTQVAIQNSIRSTLSEYFPPNAQGYHQFQFNLLPEFEGLWLPMFRNAESANASKDISKVEQILAISSQKGVKKQYASNVFNTLEHMGTKGCEVGRCARLNFRYLLANTMQAFTAQPLSNQTSENPFSNPYFLATLIMPHLETYLALHSDVRYLLLEHPAEHLPTVLALQKLAGSDLVKVAQIVDSSSKESSHFKHIRGGSLDSQPSLKSCSTMSSQVSSSTTSPRANLLLTSNASEKDIASFVSTVWNISTPDDISSSSPSSGEQNKPLPSVRGSVSIFPRSSGPLFPAAAATLGGLSPAHRPPSPSQSITTDTSRSRQYSRSKRPPRSQTPDDALSVATYDPGEDSDYDMEERRLMPMFMQKRSAKKMSTHKALKFLGLA